MPPSVNWTRLPNVSRMSGAQALRDDSNLTATARCACYAGAAATNLPLVVLHFLNAREHQHLNERRGDLLAQRETTMDFVFLYAFRSAS